MSSSPVTVLSNGTEEDRYGTHNLFQHIHQSTADIDPDDARWLDGGDLAPVLSQHKPKKPLRLGYFSVACFICNRMIGESF